MQSSTKFTKKLLPIFMAAMALLFAACGGGGGNTTSTNKPHAPASQQIYRWAVPNPDIPTFDPGQSTDALSINAILLEYTGMVQLNDQLQPAAQLASSWDKSTDGLTWTFHLKPNLKFSDGNALTSADVAYSIDRALSPTISNLSGVALTYLGLIKDATPRTQGKISSLIGDSILTPDASTVVLKLSKYTAYFLQALTYPTAYVVEKSVVSQWGLKFTDHLGDNGGQGGAGPFMVKSYDHATGIKFVPNPNYYGKKPQLSELDMVFYKTTETSYQAYLANQVDNTGIPVADFPVAKHRSDFSQTPSLTIFYLAMNYLAKPFDNTNIRQAFELAINKDAIVQGVWGGRYQPTCHIVPQGMYGYDPNLKCPGGAPTAGDQAMAKTLFQTGLQQEGWSNVSQMPPIKMTYQNGSASLDNEITTVRQMWQNVLGVTITTAKMDFGPLLTAESNTTGNAHGLQMWSAGWGADYPDPQDWTTLQFGDGQPYNEFNFGNNNGPDAAAQKAVQQALDAADVMPADTAAQQAARAQAYNNAEQQLVNYVAWLPLYQRSTQQLLKTYVVGLTTNAITEIPPDDWANVYIATH